MISDLNDKPYAEVIAMLERLAEKNDLLLSSNLIDFADDLWAIATKEKATEHRPQVSLMDAVMERKTIEEMDSAEWIAYRREKLDAYLASGKELKPTPACNFCDTHNDYVCFFCELHQVGE
jgi:hypothetical protein